MTIHDPQYLIGKEEDREYKEEQQAMAKKVWLKNKPIRKQVSERKKSIKTDYLSVWQCGRLGVSKEDLSQREEEGKIKATIYDNKKYYLREDIVNCM